jgi:hypothetical protein
MGKSGQLMPMEFYATTRLEGWTRFASHVGLGLNGGGDQLGLGDISASIMGLALLRGRGLGLG